MSIFKTIKVFVFTKFAKPNYFLHGLNIPIDRNIVTDRILFSIIRGHYESTETEAVKSLVRKGDRLLELGGGIGVVSAVSAKLLGDDAVVCIEANPTLLNYIKRVHAANSVCPKVINAVAVGSTNHKVADFYLRKNFWVSSLSPEPRDYVEKIEVEAVTIDRLVEEHRPSVVVIDIEGGEINLIQSNWTHGVRLVIMEIHPQVTGPKSAEKMTEYFMASGFSVKVVRDILFAQKQNTLKDSN
jgi:FkbM family methyltransferase